MSRAWQRSWVVATAGAFVSTVIVFGVARCRSVDREEWRRVRARAAAISAPFARGVEAHAPLLGTPQPGFADRHYVAATERCNAIPRAGDGEPEMYELLAMEELPANVQSRLAPYQPVLDALAAGATADQIDSRTFRETLVRERDPLVPGITWVGTAALVVARHDLAGGHHGSAVQRSADLLTLASDQLRVGMGLYDLIAAAYASGVCELWSDTRLRALPASEQRQLAELLLRFDLVCSPATSCAAGEAAHHASIAELDPAFRGDPAQLDAYLTAVEALPDEAAPWSAREPALAAASACLPASHRSHLPEIERARRDALVRIRLLRMALAHLLGEAVPVLLDPFGEGALLTEERADGQRFASRGESDGKPIERLVRKR